jgi:cation diffusion facilitator CzcD-associated flavoprotein CzcO
LSKHNSIRRFSSLTQSECDYLVVGAGAMGLAFVDELMINKPDAKVIMVENRDRPGGHWNSAYKYVKLH